MYNQLKSTHVQVISREIAERFIDAVNLYSQKFYIRISDIIF